MATIPSTIRYKYRRSCCLHVQRLMMEAAKFRNVGKYMSVYMASYSRTLDSWVCSWLWLNFCALKESVDAIFFFFFCCGAATQRGSWSPHSWGFLDHTQRRTTVGRTPLDEWPARRGDIYMTTHNTQNRQTSMPPDGIRTHDFSRRAAADLRLRPRGHWDRPKKNSTYVFVSSERPSSRYGLLWTTIMLRRA